MYIMTKDGWKPIATKVIPAPIGELEHNGYAYQERWQKMSFHDKYLELVNLNIHKRTKDHDYLRLF